MPNKQLQYATKEDVREIVMEAADTIVSGIDKLLQNLVTKDEAKHFSTKDDLKNFATKNDIKKLATKNDLNDLELRLSKRIDRISDEAIMKKDLKRVFGNP